MKKILFLTALMLSGLLSFAQETVSTTGPEIGLTIIPRFDLNPYFSTQSDGESGFSFGNSSLYTNLGGDINEHWSFLIVNHWLTNNTYSTSLFEGSNYLYEDSFRTDANNWVDYLNITYSIGGFSITLGKDMIATGGFEFDAWDWETHPAQMSGLWNTLPCYQWGGKITWSTPSENTTIGIQMTTSPYSDEDSKSYRPFKSGRYNYGLFWLGDYDWFHTNISLTSLQRCDWKYSWLAAAGLRFTPGQFTIDANWFNKIGRYDAEDFLAKGNTGLLSVTYTLPSEKFDFTVKGGYEKAGESNDENIYDNQFIGLTANWYPIQGDTNLRIHGAVSYDHFLRTITVTAGALFNLHIPFTRKK
ncbi:MAG: hypothetical protein KBS57_03250 [Alistipes sp.]|nr:hypothetical protein [Candidatus Minthomonas equi]